MKDARICGGIGVGAAYAPAGDAPGDAAGAIRRLDGAAGEGARRRPVECGALPFLVKRDGTWLYRGTPIPRKELVCLFSSVLKRDADGRFLLETPAERGHIEVEDTPWLAVELDWCGAGKDQVLSFRTNVDQVVAACEEHPIRIAENRSNCTPVPYLHIRDGDGMHPLEARISRPVYYELAAIAVPGRFRGRSCYGVWSCGRFFPIGDTPPGEA